MLKSKANKGDIDAAWKLYGCYEEDDKESVHWLKVGARAGDQRAKYNLYSILKNRGDNDSVLYLLDAASHNYTLAQRDLAELFVSGQYWQKDISAAEYWLYRASDNGDNIAMYELAKLLSSQEGNNAEACSLARKALLMINKKSELSSEISTFIGANCK